MEKFVSAMDGGDCCRWLGFLLVESAGVSEAGGDEHDEHDEGGNDAGEIEEAVAVVGEVDVGELRMEIESEIGDGEEDADFSGAKTSVGHVEDAEGVGGEVGLDGEQEEGDEKGGSGGPCHVGGGGQTGGEEECAEGVDEVVDVEAVTRALLIADACESAVEAVAEPVGREGDGGAEEA